jgi:uncharacterized protein
VRADRLDATTLAFALKSGVHRMLGDAERLDRINVFPVPDGDTGTNLSLTLSALLPVLSAPHAGVGALLGSVADTALDNARGNSGAIVAQWLLGVADHAATMRELDAAGLGAALENGARYAREAIGEPRAGTILDVLDTVAAQMGRADDDSLVRRARAALDAATDTLERTREGLEEMRRAGVVDAGGAGFLALWTGVVAYLETGDVAPLSTDFSQPTAEPEAAGGDTDLTHRWCTECLVEGAVDRRALRERLAAFGSSLVVAGTQRKVRIHVHTSDPARVFETAGEFGSVSGQKADDMQRQQASTAHAGRRRVAIVTDSAADLPDEALEALDIHLVAVRLHFGQQSFLDKVSLNAEQFYRLLATEPHPPKTSQPAPGDFRRLYEHLASHHDSVVSLHVSSRASGTFQSAETAAQRTNAKDRIHVIDTGNASVGQGLLAIYAAECAAQGWDGPAVAAAVQAMRPRTRTFAYLPTLDYAVRGGRVPPIARTLARVLRLSPLLATFPDGRIGLGGVLLGLSNGPKKFARFLGRQIDSDRRYRLLVAHGDAPQAGHALEQWLRRRHPCIAESWVVPSGAALGVHGGPGFLAVALQEYEAPEGHQP